MSKLYDLQELVDQTRLPERTVRYYLNKVLDAPGGTRGRKAFYSQETLNQLMLAKQVLMREYDPKRGEVKPSLMDFQHWLKALSAKEIHEMLEMPYRIKPKTLMAASAPRSSVPQPSSPRPSRLKRSQPLASEPLKDYSISHQVEEEGKKNSKDSAAQYLNRVMSSSPPPSSDRSTWHSFRFGDDLEIRTRKRISPQQQEQLRLAGKLLQSVLKEG
jgi:hypothetical protein